MALEILKKKSFSIFMTLKRLKNSLENFLVLEKPKLKFLETFMAFEKLYKNFLNFILLKRLKKNIGNSHKNIFQICMALKCPKKCLKI